MSRPRKTLTVEELAQAVGVHRNTVLTLIDQGSLGARRFHGELRVSRVQVEPLRQWHRARVREGLPIPGQPVLRRPNRAPRLAEDVELLEDAARRAPGVDWRRVADLACAGHGAGPEAGAALTLAGVDVVRIVGAAARLHLRAGKLEQRVARLFEAIGWTALDRRRGAACPLVQDLADHEAEARLLASLLAVARAGKRGRRTRRTLRVVA